MESNLAERVGLTALTALLALGLGLSVDAFTGGHLARWIVDVLIA